LAILRLRFPVAGDLLVPTAATFTPPRVPFTGTPLSAIGFGGTGPNGVGVGTRRVTTLTYSRDENGVVADTFPGIKSDVYALDGPADNALAAACPGDSGGALISSGRRLVGVLASIDPACSDAKRTTSHAVRLGPRLGWISATVTKAIDPTLAACVQPVLT